MTYFRGRSDVYARLWTSNRTGKKGYSPVCANEWVHRICGKPGVKCSECRNQKFMPLDTNAIVEHLSGNQVIGIYPMLQNDNCFFLAMDFDREHWLDDISVLKKICNDEGIPAIIERSRSGTGGHLWIFFNEEIPAVLARKLGSYLITIAMNKRYQIDMKSYDRLFPNQDTLPKGGFGNLIALPFQKKSVGDGNSVFIDEKGVPFPDQWDFLSSIRSMSYQEVQGIVDKAMKTGQIIAVKHGSVDENIEFFAEIHEVTDYHARRNELLEFTRLTPFRDRLADQLSGGMKQKLALAATLIHKPELIFLDEPTTGVDPVSRREFWKILSSLMHEGITIFMTTPYIDEAERCGRVGLMNGGKILLADTPQNVKKTMKGAVIEIIPKDLNAASDALHKRPEIQEVQTFGDRINVVATEGTRPEMVGEWLRGAGVTVESLRPVEASLENVFISLLKEGTPVEAEEGNG